MTDTATQTGRDGATVSAAAPCRTPACASCAGGLAQRQARSARGQILIPDGPAHRRFACPDLGETERRGPSAAICAR
jgi:hypothetical protein